MNDLWKFCRFSSVSLYSGVEADSKFAQELHQKLSLASFPNASTIAEQPAEPCTADAADTDEQFARRLQEELNKGINSPLQSADVVDPTQGG